MAIDDRSDSRCSDGDGRLERDLRAIDRSFGALTDNDCARDRGPDDRSAYLATLQATAPRAF
jgi:hypothetical protein